MLKEQVRQLEERLESPNMSDNAYTKIIDRIRSLQEDQIPRHRDTITVSLVKNKRPPMTLVDDIDFRLDRETGRLLPLFFEGDDPDDEPPLPLPETYTSGGSARDLLKERK